MFPWRRQSVWFCLAGGFALLGVASIWQPELKTDSTHRPTTTPVVYRTQEQIPPDWDAPAATNADIVRDEAVFSGLEKPFEAAVRQRPTLRNALALEGIPAHLPETHDSVRVLERPEDRRHTEPVPAAVVRASFGAHLERQPLQAPVQPTTTRFPDDGPFAEQRTVTPNESFETTQHRQTDSKRSPWQNESPKQIVWLSGHIEFDPPETPGNSAP